MKDNQDRIFQAIEYNPLGELTYEGQTLPRLGWEGKKTSEYGFIDTDDEEEEEIDTDDEGDKEDDTDDEKPSTRKTALNLDRSMNDEYKTLLKDQGLDLPSEIFKAQKNVVYAIVKVKAKIKRSEDYITDNSTKKGNH